MTAPVELELHRLSKQRGAHERQRKAAHISTLKQKHQAVSDPSFRYVTKTNLDSNETAIIGKGLQNALKWYMGMPSKVNIKKVTTLINAKNTGICQPLITPKRIGRCVTF